MAVYFDHRLSTDRAGINTDVNWYSGAPVLAVTSFSDDSGGSVNLFLDEAGVLMIWKADSKGRLQQNPLHQHHITEPLTRILFKPLPPADPNHIYLQTAVVQYGPSSLSIEMFANGSHHDLKTDIQVKGIATTKGTVKQLINFTDVEGQPSEGQIDPKLYFWDVEVDTVSYFNFETGRGEQDDFPPEQIEGLQVDSNDAERYSH
ncbi:hypothetical protein KUTeg_004551 [Tegillarca granosa]|uniref:Uncharacterized protein n=1 Tax=Tegillarca granosa TaxID=220873 RepID=A0ABQ9FQC7_TEGGR|nr:hypothetical protein KUTeg_004551 [Tegillarca granosa]